MEMHPLVALEAESEAKGDRPAPSLKPPAQGPSASSSSEQPLWLVVASLQPLPPLSHGFSLRLWLTRTVITGLNPLQSSMASSYSIMSAKALLPIRQQAELPEGHEFGDAAHPSIEANEEEWAVQSPTGLHSFQNPREACGSFGSDLKAEEWTVMTLLATSQGTRVTRCTQHTTYTHVTSQYTYVHDTMHPIHDLHTCHEPGHTHDRMHPAHDLHVP